MRAIDDATVWQIVSYRGFFLAGTISTLYVLQQRGRAFANIRAITRWGLLGGILLAMANCTYLWSLDHTTVANTAFTLSAIPFFTAIFAYLALGETVRRSTWIAMGVAMLGIGVMVYDGLAAGTFAGNVAALVTALAFSAYVVILRLGRATNMLPVVVLSGLLAGTAGAYMSGGDLRISTHDLVLAFIWGSLISGLSHVLFNFGSRHVTGAELTLIVLIEFILGPIWVWLLFAETVSRTTLLGGALVLLAVASRGLVGIAPKRKTPMV